MEAIELQALEGELLGDGSLYIGKRYTNACFQLQAKAQGQVHLAFAALSHLGGHPHSFIRNSSGYRSTPVQMYGWRSHRSALLTEMYHEWYHAGVKAVPRDFTLTPTSALHWYIGDGSLHRAQASIVLCTDNFDELSIRHLQNELFSNGFQPTTRTTCKGHLRLALTGACVDAFLIWVGSCPIPEMVHKWSVVSRKYSTKRVSLQERRVILQLRAQNYSYSNIAKRVGRNISTVHEVVNGRVRRA
jgi:hypothetical protein